MHHLKTLHNVVLETVCTLLVGLRPLLGPARCRYPRGCTTFTVHRLRTTPLHRAVWAMLRRLYSCATWQPLDKDLFE